MHPIDNVAYADVITTSPMHESFSIQVIDRGCNNDKLNNLSLSKQPLPAYPVELRNKLMAGVVSFSFKLDETGGAIDIKIIHSSDISLVKPVLESVSKWRYKFIPFEDVDKQSLAQGLFVYSIVFSINTPLSVDYNGG